MPIEESGLPDLTETQREALRLIRHSILKMQGAPTVRELCDAFGWKSPNAPRVHLEQLRLKGYIEIDRGVNRGIRLKGWRVKLVREE